MSDEFSPFGGMHAAVIAVAVLAWWLAVRWAKRVHGTSREGPFRRLSSCCMLGVSFVWVGVKLIPSNWNLDTSLPLHLCDFAWMVAAWSLWTGGAGGRVRHQLLYYWGFGLTPLAFLTPTLTDGPTHLYFWIFWLVHGQIIAAALCNQCAFGVRQSWAGYRAAVGVSLGLFTLVWAFNQQFDTPYFFSGDHSPENPTPIDVLGPYPLRLLWMVLLVMGLFAAMTWMGKGRLPCEPDARE